MALRRDLHWPSLIFLATGLLSVGPVDILAQTSTVVCNSSFSWVRRSTPGREFHSQNFFPDGQQQGPEPLSCRSISARRVQQWAYVPSLCLIVSYSSDVHQEYTVNPLPSKTYYTGPNAGEQNDCQCSTVTYCAMSACGACQNTGFVG